MIHVNKDASVLYTSTALMTVVNKQIEFLTSTGAVNYQVKAILNNIVKRHQDLQQYIRLNTQPEHLHLWNHEFTTKDCESFSSVLGYMSDMTDEQRSELEAIAQKIANERTDTTSAG